MKNYSCVIVGFYVICLLSIKIAAQDASKHDPLAGPFGEYPIWAKCAEIVSIIDSVMGPSDQVLSQKIYDLTPNGQIAESSPYLPGSGSYGINDALWSDCIAGDFDGDRIDEMVTGWISPDGYLHMDMSSATRLKPAYSWQWNQRLLWNDNDYWNKCSGPIRLLAVNLDSTFRKEIVACIPLYDQYNRWWDIKVLPFYMEDHGQDLFQGTAASFNSGIPYDIAAADLNGDGIDELVHVYHDDYGNNPPYATIYAYVYDSGGKKFKFMAGIGIPTTNEQWSAWKRLKITTGDFRNLGRDEIVVSLTLTNGNRGRQVFNYITYRWSGQYLDFYSWSPPGSSPAGWTWGDGWESDAVAADINPDKNDGEELIVAGPGEVAVLKFNSSLVPYYCGEGNAKTSFLNDGALETFERRRFLAVSDVDADTNSATWIKEIIVAEHKQDSTTVIRVLSPNINGNNDITGLSENAIYASAIKSRRSEIAVGDFDGDAIRLGPPTLLTKQSVFQPIVELKVPPTHFDYLNDQVYDVCQVHGTTPSEFKVTYTETQSQTSYFSSELTQDWGVSTELSGGFSLFDAEVKVSVQASYDNGYYGSHSQNTTVTASQVTSSTGDDWILATVSDYDFWEYPLLAMGTCFGHILVQVPHYKGTEWFPSRNVNARDWIAYNEVGNLFSYPRKEDIAARTGTQLLTSFTGKYISIASQGSWSLDLSSQTIDETKLTNTFGSEVGVSVSGWGTEVNVSGKYSREEITTHTSTATKDVEVEVEVSETDKTYGDTDYLVTPYMYWGQNGAMVIDYAVDFATTGDPDLGTFWDKNYLLHSDPGFILPWRLDSLKGIGGTDDLKFYSKSLRVSPIAPAAGDTAQITANVHNFSLKNTEGPVTVRFYLGDPANGGTPIEGIGGLTDLSTGSSIPAQNYIAVEMDWLVPSDLSSKTKVYAAIDPDNAITEIHKDNNVGFVSLKPQGATGFEEESIHPLPDYYVLQQNFPNPFNPTTTITYNLQLSSHIQLTIYDVLGRKVKQLVDAQIPAGHYKITWDATNDLGERVTSGLYFCRMEAEDFVDVIKLVLVK